MAWSKQARAAAAVARKRGAKLRITKRGHIGRSSNKIRAIGVKVGAKRAKPSLPGSKSTKLQKDLYAAQVGDPNLVAAQRKKRAAKAAKRHRAALKKKGK